MKTRQFVRLASVAAERRDQLLLEGLRRLGANITTLIVEIDECNQAGARRAATLLRNIGREEAGKFLILLAIAQMADYSIGSRSEMLRAIEHHRRELYLDGPNDFDFIMRNDLIDEREGALYVDLVDADSELLWLAPTELDFPVAASTSMQLVAAITASDLISPQGFRRLRQAWSDFDPQSESHHDEWSQRTIQALQHTAADLPPTDNSWAQLAGRIAYDWPMPLVHLDLDEKKIPRTDLVRERERRSQALLEEQFGGS